MSKKDFSEFVKNSIPTILSTIIAIFFYAIVLWKDQAVMLERLKSIDSRLTEIKSDFKEHSKRDDVLFTKLLEK